MLRPMFPLIFFSLSAHQISCVQEKISSVQHISQKCFLTSHEKFPLYPTKISHDFFLFLVIDHFFGNFYLLRTQNRHFFTQLSSEIPVFVVSAMCAKTFLKENFCALQLFFCARVSRPVCARAQLRGNVG